MVKLSKCKKLLKEYKDTILYSAVAVLGLIAIASTIHHAITVITVVCLIGVCAYILWSKK